jgi:phage tail sheath protein FI
MVSTYLYPGVYIEEVPSGVHVIAGVSTSDTAFVDYFPRGPVNQAIQINNFPEFQRTFGGLNEESEAGYAILQYFLNGGQLARIVRVTVDACTACRVLNGKGSSYPALTVDATSPGTWGNNIRIRVSYPQRVTATEGSFDIHVRQVDAKGNPVIEEQYQNLSMNQLSPRYAPNVVNGASALILLNDVGLDLPEATDDFVPLECGNDGTVPRNNGAWPGEIVKGLEALQAESVNILCLPVTALFDTNGAKSVISAAQQFCYDRRAFYIIDGPRDHVDTPTKIIDWIDDKIGRGSYAAWSALYFPRLLIPDPLNQYRSRDVGPSGTLAGVFARTDANRGVWKAPAGTDATLNGANVNVRLTDADSAILNPAGIDALRNFPVYGNIVWGARTLAGSNDAGSADFRYVPVRRLTSYIEDSLYRGTQWAVFEPNDATLWASLRLAVNDFMSGLALQGAFYGYYVQCDETTTTQYDIDRGICNIIVAFAPVKPAEFIVIRIEQLAGQATA